MVKDKDIKLSGAENILTLFSLKWEAQTSHFFFFLTFAF